MKKNFFIKIAEELADTSQNNYESEYQKQYSYLLQNKNKILQFLSEYEKLTGKNFSQYKNVDDTVQSLLNFYNNIYYIVQNEQNTRQQVMLNSIDRIIKNLEGSISFLRKKDLDAKKFLTENKHKK
jgi:hypothetical protein